MSTIHDQPPKKPEEVQSPSACEFLGDLSAAVIKGTGTLIYGASCYLAERISLTKHGEKVEEYRNKWKKAEEVALKVCFALGAFYNCYTNCITFTIGVVIGFLATLPMPFIGLSFLEKYPMSGWEKDSGYMTQKVMGILFALNFFDFIKYPIIDNMVFGGLAGFVVGFTINRIVKEQFGGSYKTFCKSAQETANALITKTGLEKYITPAKVIEIQGEEVSVSAEGQPN